MPWGRRSGPPLSPAGRVAAFLVLLLLPGFVLFLATWISPTAQLTGVALLVVLLVLMFLIVAVSVALLAWSRRR